MNKYLVIGLALVLLTAIAAPAVSQGEGSNIPSPPSFYTWITPPADICRINDVPQVVTVGKGYGATVLFSYWATNGELVTQSWSKTFSFSPWVLDWEERMPLAFPCS